MRESKDSIQDALADVDDEADEMSFGEYNRKRPDADDSDDLSEEEKALIDAANDDTEEDSSHDSRSRHGRPNAHIMKWSQVAGVHDNPKNYKGFQSHKKWNEASVQKQMDEGDSSDEDDLTREERELIAAASKHPRGKVTPRKHVKEAQYVKKHGKALAEEDLRRTKKDAHHENRDEDDLSSEEKDLLAHAHGKK